MHVIFVEPRFPAYQRNFVRALAEVGEYVEADAVWQRLTGLEFWFTPPAGTVVPQPSRWRMALVMIAVVYGLYTAVTNPLWFIAGICVLVVVMGFALWMLAKFVRYACAKIAGMFRGKPA